MAKIKSKLAYLLALFVPITFSQDADEPKTAGSEKGHGKQWQVFLKLLKQWHLEMDYYTYQFSYLSLLMWYIKVLYSLLFYVRIHMNTYA